MIGASTGSTAKTEAINAALVEAERAVRPLRALSRRHADLIRLLTASGRRADAVEVLASTRGLNPGGPEDFEALAFVAHGLGEYTLARDYYAVVVRLAGHDAVAWYNLATSERNLGNLEAAETACERAIDGDARNFQAHLLRAQLRTQSERRNHIENLTRCLSENEGSPQAQIFLHYALGKEWDDLGRYAEAFEHFAAGAAVRRRTLQYDVAQDVQKLQRIATVFDHDCLARPAPRHRSDYAFVIGLPRSGTTLIERVLLGHPSVRSNGETDHVSAALMAALSPSGDDVFERASLADPARIAQGYAARAGRPPPGGVMLEKLPMNYLYVGAINRAMPEARFIAVRRNPLANCFAMFSTLFGSAYPFSYDFGELAAYFTAYQTLMDHWKFGLPEQILEVRYESFVEAPLEIGPGVARHLGLDWSDRMARIERNHTPSATASAVQIRQPIYTHAAGRWRNYLTWLAPLADKLAAAGVDIGA